MNTKTVVLKDKGRGRIYLSIRGGTVVGAMGSDPARYIGLTEARARHVARTTWAAFEYFTLDVTWHETAGAYSVRFAGPHAPRVVANLKAACHDHDAFGRSYHVYAHTTDGRRVELNGAAVARLGA